MNSKAAQYAMPFAVTAAIFIIWEIACVVLAVPAYVLPRPEAIFASMIKHHDALTYHAVHTLYTTLIGFVLAVAGGLLLGLVIGSSRLLYSGLYPVLVGFNSIPKVAIVPVLVIWFGIGFVPAVITAFVVSFFPVTVNVATGLATLEPELEDVLRALGASRIEILQKVGIPRTLPYLFASLKVAITLAFIGSVISETIASNEGIGYLILTSSAKFDVPLVFAALLIIAAMGIAMYAVFAAMESRMTGWATRRIEYAAGG
jgi:NitT/TauT family transport system permease protein